MRKSDCELGMLVWVRGCSFQARIRAFGAEDVHLAWSQKAIDHHIQHFGNRPPEHVGYNDITDVLLDKAGNKYLGPNVGYVKGDTLPVPDLPDPAPDAGTDEQNDYRSEWQEFWHRFEHILEDRRRLTSELQAALPLALPHAVTTDRIMALPPNLVTDLGLLSLRQRVLEVRERLGDLKLDASTYLQRRYDQLVQDSRLDRPTQDEPT